MKTKLFKSFFISAVMGCCAAHAEIVTRVTVQQSDDTNDFIMHRSGKMYFSDDNLVIDTIGSGPSFSAKLASIDKLLFSTVELTTNGTERIVNDASSIMVYPLNVENTLYVKGAGQTVSYSIVSVSGQKMMSGTCNNDDSIDVSSISKGVYFVIINGSIFKFVKS